MKKAILIQIILMLCMLMGCHAVENGNIGIFSFSDYQKEFEVLYPLGPSELTIYDEVPVHSAQEARKVALQVWLEIYGTSVIFQSPFDVSYDEVSGVWYVTGRYKENSEGGTAGIIIEEMTGAILDCWHGK